LLEHNLQRKKFYNIDHQITQIQIKLYDFEAC
jgi:hypothetical protein